jgi:hypothetical protein
MSPEIHDLMALQGEVKVYLMRVGIQSNLADDIAAEVLHMVAICPVASEAHRKAYASTSSPDPQTPKRESENG